MLGSKTGASARILGFIITEESSRTEVCWGLMGPTCLVEGNVSWPIA